MHDVAVIGGGIAGCATAYFLAADGVDVVLLERGELNALASGSNAGSLHAQIPHDTFEQLGPDWARGFTPTLRLFLESIELWREADRWLDTPLEVSTPGGVLVAADERQMRSIEVKAAIEREAGLEVELLDRSGLHALAPYVSEQMVGGMYCRQEGKANPLLAASAFARAAGGLGANILRHCHVAGIQRSAAGFELQTGTGTVHARRLVNAAGAQADAVAAMLGLSLDLKLQRYPIQVSVTEPAEPLLAHLLYYARAPLTMKQSAAGTVLIGGGWPARIDRLGRPSVDPESLSANLGFAMELVPRLGSLNVVRTWAAIVNGTEDWRPWLGEVPGFPGFFMCYVPWMGFTAGPAAGRLIADVVQGRGASLEVDMRAFVPG